MGPTPMKTTVALLSCYAIAMALLESAIVVYMRRLYYPENPLELFPLQFLGACDPVLEFSREVATVVMIIVVALLAERRSFTRCFAAFVFVFGLWDLFYYVWLKILIGWPQHWLEWDVLFLVPAIWLGPWICPVLIAFLFVTWGAWAICAKEEIAFSFSGAIAFVTGAALGLAAFMQPAISNGSETLIDYQPGVFWWWLFVPGYLLMTLGFFSTIRSQRQSNFRPG